MQQEEKRLILEFMKLLERTIDSLYTPYLYEKDKLEKIIEDFEKTGK